ncbi:MAG: hypothetical protein EXR69_08665, partial [Myxococcales bacterium]|nr:hypothetical protein [Myxococcales bacterium]
MARAHPVPSLLHGVTAAVTCLGCGFLSHPGSAALNERLASGALGVGEYYAQLLTLTYRLIVRIVTEQDDGLLSWPGLADALRGRHPEDRDLASASISERDLETALAGLRSTLHLWTCAPALGSPDLGSPGPGSPAPGPSDELGSVYEALLTRVPRLGSGPGGF